METILSLLCPYTKCVLYKLKYNIASISILHVIYLCRNGHELSVTVATMQL